MRKALAVVGLSLVAFNAQAADYFEPTYFSTGYFETDYFEVSAGGTVAVPNVVGLDVAAADTALDADGLDTGAVTMRCSAEVADEVLSQNPAAAVVVDVGTTVDLVTSDGMVCPPGGGAGLRLRLDLGL